ncbi:MAG TPA: viroplasmin family protein, partial [Arenibacter sp.]|nr:viroplasmin family protein [Arenibacter sp.]
MAKKGKFYTVWKGHQPGIYQNWKDCKAAIINFKGAQYKSFPTFEAAKKAFNGNYNDYKGKATKEVTLSNEELIKIGAPNYNSISVDAASSGNPGIMEYRGVDTRTKKELFKQGPFKQGTNNIGEFLALVHGLAYLKRHNSDRIIYT